MKIILFLLISTTFIFSQSYCSTTESSHKNTLLNNLSFQRNNTFNSKYLVQELNRNGKILNQTIFANSSSDSTVRKNDKIFRAGLAGSFGFGLMGAFIGYKAKTKCAGSSDVIQICSGDGHYSRLGASIGGVSGSISGYLSKRKEIKQRVPFLKIVIGSIAGGVVGYFLTDVTFGMSALIFPPVGANILLHL